MSVENLTSYMQDHAAGASAALDLLDHLISTHAGTAEENFFKDLRLEVEQDKIALTDLLTRFDASESAVSNTISRLGEKFSRAKFLIDGHHQGDLGRLEALDTLSLGIEGKRSLWLSLEAAAIPELQTTDFPALIARAVSQRAAVEPLRLAAASRALTAAAV